jgi:hypothetical protein
MSAGASGRALLRDGTPPNLGTWLDFAERNRVGPLVAHAILDLYPDGGHAVDRARALHDTSAARMSVLMGELDLVAGRLANADIPMVALKNAGIARGIFPCSACCPMGDIDTLVERSSFREAHALVLECGFSFASRSIVEPAHLEHAEQSGGAEYVKEVNGVEVWLELQWRAVAGRWISRDQEPDTGPLIARSVELPGTAVRLLSREDNLIQVALHTAKHSYVRAPGLRLHTDVDRLVHFSPPSWPAVVATAKQLEICTAVYFSLELARTLLNTPIPEDVLVELQPPAWKRASVVRMLRDADLFEPDEQKFARPAMMMFHALLYDTATALLASAIGTDRSELKVRNLPRNVGRGIRRMRDLVTRYQR